VIDADADVRPLGCAVITQAVRDARDVDPIRALDAVVFLLGPDVALWLEGLGLELDPVALVTSGRARHVRREVLDDKKRQHTGFGRGTHARGSAGISLSAFGSREGNPRGDSGACGPTSRDNW